MKIAIVSDLHLEFWGQRVSRIIAEKLNASNADLFLVAGDIHPGKEERDRFYSMLQKPYYAVMGNHDYYGSPLSDCSFVDDRHGFKVVGATLWTSLNDGDYLAQNFWKRSMADARLIREVGTDSVMELHAKHRDLIFAENPSVVVTHHSPSERSVAEKFKHAGASNYAFFTNLEEEIMKNDIRLWVHGHMHNFVDYMIGTCRIINNPLGYPGEGFVNVEYYDPYVIDMEFDNEAREGV